MVFHRDPTPHPRDNVTSWTNFRLSTSDYLMIDSTSATMKHHLRADKVDFWARLIPAVWDYQLHRQHDALLGYDAGCQATLSGARSAVWILVGVMIVLMTLLVICALLAARYHRQQRRMSVSTGQDSVAKIWTPQAACTVDQTVFEVFAEFVHRLTMSEIRQKALLLTLISFCSSQFVKSWQLVRNSDVGLATRGPSWVCFPAVTPPGHFWNRWPSSAGKLSWDIATTRVNTALRPSGVAKWSTSFGWGKRLESRSCRVEGNTVWSQGMWFPVAVWRLTWNWYCCYTYLLLYELSCSCSQTIEAVSSENIIS